MLGFRDNESDAVYGVLIDISSGTVGVAIVESLPGAKLPTILYEHRITMRVTKHGAEKSENLRRVREALFSASLILSQEGHKVLLAHDPHAVLTKMYVTCSSPWSYTVSRDVRYENDQPFKVTKEVMSDLVGSAEHEILSHIQSLSQVSEHGFNIVERVTVDMTLNEYPVRDPLNLKGSSLGLSHVAGLIPKDILDAVHEVQEKLFTATELRTHTYMLVMYCVIRDIFPRLDSECIIDVTGEATEFAIVAHNSLIENRSIPAGCNTLIRDIMSHTGKPAADIESRMHGEHDTHYTEDHAFMERVTAYEESVRDAISEMIEHHALPENIIITVQRPYEHFFEAILERVLKEVAGKKLTVFSIHQNIIDEISNGTSDDVYLALGARFFHKLHGCGDIQYS